MIIRKATQEDVPEMLDIYNEAIRNLTATFDLTEQSLDERKAWFNRYCKHYPLLVAELDGNVIGYCGLFPYNPKAAYEKTVEISIYLAAKSRGLGVGKLLMTEILSEAEKHGFHTIIAGITDGNDSSVRLHEKFGFKLAGRLKEVGFKFGQWHDVLYYQLMLPKKQK